MSDKQTLYSHLISFLDRIIALLWRCRFGPEWEYIPVHESDRPVMIVPMSAPEYAALVLLGYPEPEGHEIDWTIVPPPDVDDEQIAAMRLEAIEAARTVVRRHIAEWEAAE